jgi:hypothetical protein
MAFPTSPVDGQIYKDKIYNLTLNVWKKYKMDWVEIWGPTNSNTPASTISGLNLIDGIYRIYVTGFANTTDDCSFELEVNRTIGSGIGFYSNEFSLTTATNSISIEHKTDTNTMRILGYGTYASGKISSIKIWQEVES